MGRQYFIGLDSGNHTPTAATLGVRVWDTGSAILTGHLMENLNGTGFIIRTDRDIASEIVMVPEPDAATLFGLMLLGTAARRRVWIPHVGGARDVRHVFA